MAHREVRQGLLKNDHTIDQQGEQLKGMERNLNETEQIGIQIKQELHNQREKIVKTNNTVKDTRHELRKVDRLAGEISNRYICFKIMLWILIIVLFIAIIIILAVKLSRR